MPHFYIEKKQIENNIIKISDKELLNHLVSSLRIKAGEKLLFFDEDKIKYETTVLSADKNILAAKIDKKYESNRYLDVDISLMAAILKQDAFNLLIDSVTQLGVKALYPVYAQNCVPSKKQIENKTSKWQRISDEAVKQCERVNFMKVYETANLYKFDYSKFNKVIVFSEKEDEITLKKILKENVTSKDKILVIVGPEGGFSKDEFKFFEDKKFNCVKISDLIFKAQNACISGISNIIYELGEI